MITHSSNLKQNTTPKKSCNRPCSPGDYCPCGYCDKAGCYTYDVIVEVTVKVSHTHKTVYLPQGIEENLKQLQQVLELFKNSNYSAQYFIP